MNSFEDVPIAKPLVTRLFAGGLVAVIAGVVLVLGSLAAGVATNAFAPAQHEDKTWSVLVLVLGLLSFGFVAMLAYVLAGPDGTRATQVRGAAHA